MMVSVDVGLGLMELIQSTTGLGGGKRLKMTKRVREDRSQGLVLLLGADTLPATLHVASIFLVFLIAAFIEFRLHYLLK